MQTSSDGSNLYYTPPNLNQNIQNYGYGNPNYAPNYEFSSNQQTYNYTQQPQFPQPHPCIFPQGVYYPAPSQINPAQPNLGYFQSHIMEPMSNFTFNNPPTTIPCDSRNQTLSQTPYNTQSTETYHPPNQKPKLPIPSKEENARSVDTPLETNQEETIIKINDFQEVRSRKKKRDPISPDSQERRVKPKQNLYNTQNRFQALAAASQNNSTADSSQDESENKAENKKAETIPPFIIH
ncbi:hypothetical protein RI129_004817 [Pyrocoelia pectoralis]|uniref:Uncharacterized protein n=1 Tax=Pyrocoelia pectoralis TaxID=417401 RepID=A0AAN7VJL3_9COLE